MLSLLALLLAGVVGALAGSSTLLPNACPTPGAVPNFNATAFLGIWYDQHHTARHTRFRLRCDLNNFISPNSGAFMFNSYSYSAASKNVISASVKVEIPQNSNGKLLLSIPAQNVKGYVFVISTDYVSFAVLWSCTPKDGMHYEQAVVMTRGKNPGMSLSNVGKKALESNGLYTKDLSTTMQHDCPKYNVNTTTLSSTDPFSSVTSIGSLIIPEKFINPPEPSNSSMSSTPGLKMS